MPSSRTLLLIGALLFFFTACTSSNDAETVEGLPTLVPTADLSSLPAVAETTPRPFPIVTFEDVTLGIQVDHPENWEARILNENLIRFVPDPDSMSGLDPLISPVALVQIGPPASLGLGESEDASPSALLEQYLATLGDEITITAPPTAVTYNRQSGSRVTFLQTSANLVPEDETPEEEVLETGTISHFVVALTANEQVLLFIGTAAEGDMGFVQPIFERMLNSLDISTPRLGPTE